MLLVIFIDNIPLNGNYLGSMFIVVAMEGNHGHVLIAFGLVIIESDNVWTWLLRMLKECLNNGKEVFFISHMPSSIGLVLSIVYPYSYHGYYGRNGVWNLHDRIGRNRVVA